jgi:photoactive yellow protein
MNAAMNRYDNVFGSARSSRSRNQLEQLLSEPADAVDGLPFGAIQLSADGVILGYNRYESALSGRSQKSALGKNFFTQVAPCTNVKEFAGRFHAGVKAGRLHTVFRFLFNFRKPAWVTITLYLHKGTATAWVLVRREDEQP